MPKGQAERVGHHHPCDLRWRRPKYAVSLPKTSFGMTECDSCASGRRDVRVPDKLLLVARSRLKSRASLEAENLVLRQQVIVLSRQSRSRVRLRNIDRLIFVWLYRFFPAILNTITVVKPETVIRWHRRGFRAYWRWKSRRRGGRPKIDREIRDLIRRMSKENSLWGAPRIHGELLMLGIEVAQSTVARYMTRRQGPPSQGWKTFLRNHAAGIASIDLFVVRTISFKLLYGLVFFATPEG